ncbi:RING finger protein 17 [Pelobates fuscus]|uniref:RING finger protein 17 n=1 Tax=Pelobates fuscus TaxID=191477 RepID=UPI002FE46759
MATINLSSSQYLSIVKKIQEVVCNKQESGDFGVICPVKGQQCIAQYEDEDWYRAEVVGIRNLQEVEVKFVDFGNIARVSMSKVRRIEEELLRFPCQAIHCKLAYIQPSSTAQQWNLDACDMFGMMVADKRLKCTAIGILMDDKLSVELFEDDPKNSISINASLVEKEMASFICCEHGPLKHRLYMREIWDPVDDMLTDPFEEKMDSISVLQQKELDVIVSHVVSPSNIFVQWKTSEHFLESFQETLFNKYENTEPENTEWHADMYVAVKLPVLKQWRRGKIENISEKGVEVFIYDFGNKEMIDVNNIRTLEESHKAYGSFCLECSLMDIQPSGGSTEWTKTACEVLSYYLKGAKVTIIIEENASKWPLPVKMACKDEAGQHVDISSFLIKQGLALRERRLNKPKTLEVSESIAEITVAEHVVLEEKPDCDVEPDQTPFQKNDASTSNIEKNEEPMTEQNINEPYIPPVIPDSKIFMAKVTHITEQGIVYVIHESLESDLGKLMSDVQEYLKGPGLLMPYCWKKGDGCLIKGPDNMSYRGKVLEIIGGDMIKVQYEDFGSTETIPKCHLHPHTFRPNIPCFCIPCQLHNVLPLGGKWQPDAIELLKELLIDRHVRVHLMETPKFSGDIASVDLYCDNAPVTAILDIHGHCVVEDNEKRTKEKMDVFESSLEKRGGGGGGGGGNCVTNCYSKECLKETFDLNYEDLLLPDQETPFLQGYAPLSLPQTGELFPVNISHLETPNIVYISCNSSEDCQNESEETLQASLEKVNLYEKELKPVTDYRPEMPCLARYHDGQIYRAKLKSIQGFNPVSVVVQFVDYGSNAVVQSDSIFQLPDNLVTYPVKALKVRLAGFKPPMKDCETVRIPYFPAWSMKALYTMMDLIEEKATLFASCTAASQETSVFIYDENHQLLHEPLVSMGLADYS